MYTEYLSFIGELYIFIFQNDLLAKFFSSTFIIMILGLAFEEILRKFISDGKEAGLKSCRNARKVLIIFSIILIPTYIAIIIYGSLAVYSQRNSFGIVTEGMSYKDVVGILGNPDLDSKNGIIENTGQTTILTLGAYANNLGRAIATNDFSILHEKKESRVYKNCEWSILFIPIKINIQFTDDKVSHKFRKHYVPGVSEVITVEQVE